MSLSASQDQKSVKIQSHAKIMQKSNSTWYMYPLDMVSNDSACNFLKQSQTGGICLERSNYPSLQNNKWESARNPWIVKCRFNKAELLFKRYFSTDLFCKSFFLKPTSLWINSGHVCLLQRSAFLNLGLGWQNQGTTQFLKRRPPPSTLANTDQWESF